MSRSMNFAVSRGSRGPVSRRMTLLAVMAIAAAIMTFTSAATPATINGIILLVGAGESERVVNWYASASTNQVVQVAPTSQVDNGEFPGNASTYPAVVAANTVNGGFNGHAILDDLQENTAYSYRVGGDGGWSETYAFKTRAFDGDFDFLFFGDPQIGSSGNLPKDQAGWTDTMQVALAANPEAELLVSGGDQVETAGVEAQWTAFLAPAGLRSVPWVATIGNHDVGARAYEQHLWTPNTDRSTPFYSGNVTTQSGGDYWFLYKGVLFIDLNSNAYTFRNGVDSDEAHLGFITNVVQQHGAEAKYTVLIYHHSIYSPADHANDNDAKKRRQDFPTAFSALGVDLVLQGHDHSYSRSYVIQNGQKANASEQPGANSVVRGPGGVIYVTGNSASGSKYYALSNPDITRDPNYGPDPLNPDNHWPNSVENQENVRTYVRVAVRDNFLAVENIRSGTCAAPNAAVELGQERTCGPNLGASPALPVGSLVDQVVVSSPLNNADVVRSGVVRDRRTGLFTQQLTITNNSVAAMPGPLFVVLDNLSGTATLANGSGTTAVFPPFGPYIQVPVSPTGLAAGASVSVTLQFANPSSAAITYTTRVLNGIPIP
jgi:purple acid phosphatase-like protein/calcineurin-like phosphoesterase family protein